MPLSDLLHVFAPLVTSCRRFHSAWETATAPAAGDPLSGRWDGEWLSSDLGRFGGGVYEYAGEVTGDEFRSTFRSHTDRGTFTMRVR